jgi:serine/threonine protein kinase
VIGKTLSHYEIIERIGAGGMGEVYRARDIKLDRDVALKVLPADAAQDPERRQRFEREAKAIAALKHPHIVTIYSVENVDDIHFLTMELVDGQVLSDFVPAGGLSPQQFYEIALPLVDAVACAHAKGIAHRDLKPANIMVDKNGQLKVLDFGLAKLWSADPAQTVDSPAHTTQAGHVLGTPAYMSPEQLEGGVVDARSDVFALGIVFHELLSGAHPFHANQPTAIMVRIVRDDPPGLPGRPQALVDLVTRCLRKNRSDRFADADELGRALRTVAEVAGPDPIAAPTDPSDAPSEIRAALDRAAWQEAYDSLHALADQRALSAQELEMLADTTHWLSRWDEYTDALEKAHTAYAKAGRNRPAARVTLGLVAGFIVMNKPAAARGWLKWAERHLRDEPECVEVGLLLRQQAVDALAAGDRDRALELNRRCAEIADRTGDPDLRIVALHDHGQILIARGDVEEGMELVDEAMAAAVGGDVAPVTLGVLFCRTLIACRSLADFDRAREWTEVAGKWSEAHAASSFPGICRVHSAETMRHHGRWEEAELSVREACDWFRGVGPPCHAGEAFNELGELSLRQGNYPEAEAAFRQAHEYGYDPVPGLPLLRLAERKGPAALRMIGRALAECPADRLRRAKLLSARITIALALGETSIAKTDVSELTKTITDFPCPAFRAHALLGRGALALVRGDPTAAAPILRDAWSKFHEAGFVYDAARARVLLAKAYREAGDEEDARLQFDAAKKTFSDLGARPDLEEVTALIGEADRTE